jgi:hypothetical protein
MIPNANTGSAANIQAIEKDGVQYIPLSALVQQLGGTINWDNQAKKASLTVRGRTAEVDINDRIVRIDGQETMLSSTPVIEDSRLYVTPDFLDQIGLTHN